MDIKHQDELRSRFKKLLFDLALDQDALDEALGKKKRSNFYQELERLYWDEKFQHFSSDIFVVLCEIKKDNQKGNINILGQNLELIRRGYQKKIIFKGEIKDKDIEYNIQKLYDDVNLEISRILSDEADVWKSSQENKIFRLDNKIEESQIKLSDIEKKLKKAEEKIESSQKEYIAILGIFAAIILAFTGGITFSTSVLENMHSSSIYRVVLVILLIGFTLVNMLYLLFMFIDKLVREDKRVIPIKPLITFDISVIAFIIIIVVMWVNGIVEKRNQKVESVNVESNYSISETTEDTDDTENELATSEHEQSGSQIT